MSNIFGAARKILVILITRGKAAQDFLGARWISYWLHCLPLSWRRSAALWLVSLSPHYFFKIEANRGLNKMEFLDAEFRRNLDSRQAIASGILMKYLRFSDTLLDYGCGPGWLARAVSPYVNQVFACDISEGVIECAKVLNGAPNIQYLVVPASGKLPLRDAFVDIVYSFAVIQHVTDEVFDEILGTFYHLLKDGGTALCHIVVDQPTWKSEAESRSDATLHGKLLWHLGLYCFSRSKEDVVKRIIVAGFSKPEVFLIREIANILGDDIEDQHLFVFRKLDGSA
jgi:SAM-dependent methyltransferase